MAKFILIMFLCSSIPGNRCRSIPTPIQSFESYRDCAVFGYEYSTEMLKTFEAEAVNEYQMYTSFSCQEIKTETI
tara:strand:+ start:350 stop:574 length:225 start_codon:yes stop_codon:yes gene_type:complete